MEAAESNAGGIAGGIAEGNLDGALAARRRRLLKKHSSQLFKTHMCKYFLQGTCTNEFGCPFAHDENEIRHKPNLEKTSMCPRGEECEDETCKFAHKPEELRATQGFFKMKMCSFAEAGQCRNGASCRFAHTEDELQRPAVKAGLLKPQASEQLGGAPYPTYAPQPAGAMRAEATPWVPWAIKPVPQDAGDSALSAKGMHGTEAAVDDDDVESNVSIPSWHSSEHDADADDQTDQPSVVCEADADDQTDQVRHRASSSGTETASCSTRQTREDNEVTVTTLLLTNVPNYLTQGAFLYLLEDLYPEMKNTYDFFYCPWDNKSGKNSGYCLINFPGSGEATAFQIFWSGKEIHSGQKRLRILKAALQGLQPNVDLVSKLNALKSSELRFRPLLRDADGAMQPLILAGEDRESLK